MCVCVHLCRYFCPYPLVGHSLARRTCRLLRLSLCEPLALELLPVALEPGALRFLAALAMARVGKIAQFLYGRRFVTGGPTKEPPLL